MDARSLVRRLAAFAFVALVTATAVGACGGGDDDPSGPDDGEEPTVTTVSVSPPSATLTEIGATAQFDATARDQDGSVISGTTFDWTSSSQSVATVSSTGLATAAGEGSADITATADGVSGSASLTVDLPAEPSAIERISGGQQFGKTQRDFANPLVVRVVDDQGGAVSGVTVSWSVSAGDATLDQTTTTTDGTGRAEVVVTSGTELRTHTIEASADGLTGSPVTFEVTTSVLVIAMENIAFVDLQGRTNENAAVTVAVGDTIEWVNMDGVTHTATSGEGEGGNAGDGVPAGGTAFDSGSMAQGETFRWVAEAQGLWTYYCEIHPGVMFNSTIQVN